MGSSVAEVARAFEVNPDVLHRCIAGGANSAGPIEEFKNGFRADRLSCHRFLANAFRLLLHGFAYNLVNLFRLLQLPQPWRSAQIETLRARLFKIGARVRQTARGICVHLATAWPWQSLFRELWIKQVRTLRSLPL